MFETVDHGDDDGRALEHGYSISSPCEPDGLGELKNLNSFKISDGYSTHTKEYARCRNISAYSPTAPLFINWSTVYA